MLQFRGLEACRLIDEAGGCNATASVDELLDGVAVNQQVDRHAHFRIGESWMLCLNAGSFSIDLGPGIGRVQYDEFEVAGRDRDDLSASARFHSFENLVLNLDIPRVVVFSGL